MITISGRMGLWIAALAVAVTCAGCSAGSDEAAKGAAKAPAAQETHRVHGYPIDRSLQALATWRGLDTVVVVDRLEFEKATKVRSDNSFPSVVTPARAHVLRGLFGAHKADYLVKTVFAGGTVGNITVEPSDELAPNRAALRGASKVVIAGETRSSEELGSILDPLFVYSLDPTGRLTSLMESGGTDPNPTFTLEQLTRRLQVRTTTGR
jgi:hypothetical protein